MTTQSVQQGCTLPPRAACSAKAASVSGGGRRSRPPRPPFTNRGVVNDTYQPDFPVETLIDRKCQ